MGLFGKFKGEFVDIVEWMDDSQDTMLYRFERHDNEIKYGAKLVVRESQFAVFINMGKIADVFKPGMYELETENLPLLSTLQGWKHGFNSPFKAEVYFVNSKRFTNLKWGTKNPVMMRDQHFGPVRIRGFGSYTIRITHPDKFIKEISGTDQHFTTDEITEQLRNIIVSRFSDVIAESKIPVIDLSANYDELGDLLKKIIESEFAVYGLELTKMLVENISLPKSVEEVIDKRSGMGIVGDMGAYTQFQTANAIEDAANNQGGMAGGGLGMGMGFAMANQMGKANEPNQQAPAQQTAPPPLPAASSYFVAVGGKQAGPYDMNTLQSKIKSAEINKDSLIWKEGMAQWQKAGEVAEVAGLFPAAPPPIPG